jgi:hypothetical protein
MRRQLSLKDPYLGGDDIKEVQRALEAARGKRVWVFRTIERLSERRSAASQRAPCRSRMAERWSRSSS